MNAENVRYPEQDTPFAGPARPLAFDRIDVALVFAGIDSSDTPGDALGCCRRDCLYAPRPDPVLLFVEDSLSTPTSPLLWVTSCFSIRYMFRDARLYAGAIDQRRSSKGGSRPSVNEFE